MTTAALNTLGSILYSNFEYFAFITVGLVITPKPASVPGVQALYQFYANYIFNAFSQHYATNVRVTLVPGSYPRKAIMTAGGGEWASTIASADPVTFSPGNPVITSEQQTISNWCLEWIEIEGQWYINIYLEYGNRIFRNFPGTVYNFADASKTMTGLVPSGGNILEFQRIYPGAYYETTVPPGNNFAAGSPPPGVNIPCEPPNIQVSKLKALPADKIIQTNTNPKEWGKKVILTHLGLPCKP